MRGVELLKNSTWMRRLVLRDRYYQCKKCEAIGTIGTEFTQTFKPKNNYITHSCGSKCKWLKDYVPDSPRITEIKDQHDIYRGTVVSVKGFKEELKVIGIKPTTRKIFIEVWNPDNKFSYIVPVELVKVVR